MTPQQLQARVLSGFNGQMQRVRVAAMYRLGIVLTTALMVALPLVYVSLIALACWGVYWHLSNNHVILAGVRGKAALFMLLVNLSPLVVGSIMIAFMIKPLFAGPSQTGRKRSITPRSDPLLFAFVERICEIVRAPMPRRIDIDCDVNASAGFRRGWLSVLSGRDLVLTIGMPLAAGLSLQQFAGVLAHEFGHFSQGTGMRLTYVIRSINHWFMRVVYQRDSWDDWLANSTDGLDLRVAWVLYLAQACVWLTRRILSCLMFVGHLGGGFMLRQMEFDADKYEARLAGSDTFASTCRQLNLLNLAWRGAQADLGAFYREGRLVDDLPLLMAANLKRMPSEVRQAIDEMIAKTSTGLFDTHPADKDRIVSARAERAEGIFQSDLPARVLFADFEAASKGVTWDFYCEAFGRLVDPKQLHATKHLLAQQDREQLASEAQLRFFAGCVSPLRPLTLPSFHITAPTVAGEHEEQIAASRQRMQEAAKEYRAASQEYDAAEARLIQARQARAVLSANVRLQSNNFDRSFRSLQDASEERDKALFAQSRLKVGLEPFENATGERLFAALSLLFDNRGIGRRLPAALEMRQEVYQLLPIVSLGASHSASINELRISNAVLAALLGHISGNENSEGLLREVHDQMRHVREQLLDVRKLFERVDYPFDHADGQITVSQYLLKTPPAPEDLGGIYGGADSLLEGLQSLYSRALGRLCSFAEQVERELGHPALLAAGEA